jgi:HSP20 family protein
VAGGKTMTYLDKFIDNAFRTAMYGDVFTTSTGYKDLIRNEKEKSVISLAVPGISKDDIHLEVKEDGLLTLSFDKQTDFFRSGHKTWTLPEDIDVENVTAECKDGLLTVTLPKLKRLPSSRKVEIL